jgi:hypothetical protein
MFKLMNTACAIFAVSSQKSIKLTGVARSYCRFNALGSFFYIA